MSEEKKEEKQSTTENTGTGDKSPASKLIADTNIAAERLEKATKEFKEVEQRLAEQNALRKLGGETDNLPAEKPKEETPTDYVKRVLSGKLD